VATDPQPLQVARRPDRALELTMQCGSAATSPGPRRRTIPGGRVRIERDGELEPACW
jgi:hypothetical protein